LKQAKTAILISFISLIAALFYNEVNVHFIYSSGCYDCLRESQTILTLDDESYLTPPRNFLNGVGWKDNSIGTAAYFLRPPGYGLFLLPFLNFFQEETALQWIKYLQLILFSLSVYFLYRLVLVISDVDKIAIGVAGLYGISPFSSGFLYYTLTEGISPALLIIILFLTTQGFLSHQQKKKLLCYLIAAILLSFLIITRPVLAIFGILLPVFLMIDFGRNLLKAGIYIFLFGAIAISLMGFWQFRNYIIANEQVGLHPIYHPTNQNQYRKTHQAIWNYYKGWGKSGDDFHSLIDPFWAAVINNDNSDQLVTDLIFKIPESVVNVSGSAKVWNAFKSYQLSIVNQRPYYHDLSPMPTEIPEIEKQTITHFEILTSEFKRNMPFQYYILSPLNSFRQMIFHSNLSLSVFQCHFRGNIFMELIRLLYFSIHSIVFILLPLSFLFLKKIPVPILLINCCVLIYLFYLAFFQRGVEERYTLPVLPLLIMNAFILTRAIFKRIFRSNLSSS
jgi:hypothetical protein